MSLFSISEKNQIATRSKKVFGEKIYTWDTLSESWKQLTGIAGDDLVLPEYLKTTRIDFDDKVVIDGEKITMGPDTKITFPSVDITDEFLTTVGSTIQDLDFRTTANTTKLQGMRVIPSGISFVTKDGEVVLKEEGLRVQAYAPNPMPVYPSTLLDMTRLNFEKTTGDRTWVDYDRAKMLGQLENKLEVTEGEDGAIDFKPNTALKLSAAKAAPTLESKRMLVVDSTTKLVSHAEIPDSAAALPEYLEPSYIFMPNHELPSSAIVAPGNDEVKAYFLARDVVGLAPTSTRMSADGITFHEGGNTNPDQDILIDFDDARRLKTMRGAQENTFEWPTYAVAGGTARSVVSNTRISGFNKPIHDFNNALQKVGDTLWIDLSQWNATVSNSLETSRGIILTCDAFGFATPQWAAEYVYPGVTTTAQNVYVSNTNSSIEKHCVFIAFQKVAGGDISINGWLRLAIVGLRLALPNDDLITGAASPTTEVMP